MLITLKLLNYIKIKKDILHFNEKKIILIIIIYM